MCTETVAYVESEPLFSRRYRHEYYPLIRRQSVTTISISRLCRYNRKFPARNQFLKPRSAIISQAVAERPTLVAIKRAIVWQRWRHLVQPATNWPLSTSCRMIIPNHPSAALAFSDKGSAAGAPLPRDAHKEKEKENWVGEFNFWEV